jgi:hypothetical protein
MPIKFTDYPDMIVGPNMDLSNRPQVKNKQAGGTSSVWSMSVGFTEGDKEVTYLIPRISKDGKIMTPDEAIEYFRKTKEHLGKFRTKKEADRFSRAYSASLGKKK